MDVNSNSTKLSIRHLRCAVAVARNHSMTGAAIDCNVALSALSETIRQIESDLGVTLFDRSQRPLVVTELGNQFIYDSIEVLNRFDQSICDMRALRNKEKDIIHFASSSSSFLSLIIPSFIDFRKKHPNVGFSMRQESAKNINKLLRDGFIEFAIHKLVKGDNLESKLLLRENYGLVCSIKHRLANRSTIKLADISNLNFIQLHDDMEIIKLLNHGNKINNAHVESSDVISIIWLVSQNLGVSILPENAIMIPTKDDVCFIPIVDLKLNRGIYLLSSKQHPTSPTTKSFIKIIEAFANIHAEQL